MYKKVSTNLNFVEREKQTEKFWKDNDIFKKSMDSRKEGETNIKDVYLKTHNIPILTITANTKTILFPTILPLSLNFPSKSPNI